MNHRSSKHFAAATLVVALATSSRVAHATYSIVATDSASRQVGGAGTSCVGNLNVSVIYGRAPGFGAVAAQARLEPSNRPRDEAVRQLADGIAPAQIITSITAAQFDFSFSSRQYGIVDLLGRAAGFTGDNTLDFADDRQGSAGTYAYSVQGNILTGVAVLDQAAAAFETTGCDLADKLMLALEAGAENGQGDSRCTPDGIPSDGAFIEVDRDNEAAGSFLRLTNVDTSPQNPISLLREEYDAWRQSHPCPAGSGGAGGSAGSGGAGAAGGASGSGGAVGTGGTGGTPAVGGSAASASSSGEDSSCACTVPTGTTQDHAALLLLTFGLALARCRRR